MQIEANFWKSTAAGIAGTSLLVFSVYLQSFITKARFRLVRIFGTMLTGRTAIDGGISLKPSTAIVGWIAMGKAGITFASIYAWLWAHDVGAPDLYNAIWFGFAHGLMAVLFWWWFIALHPRPPVLPLASYLPTIFLAHFIFSLGVTGAYQLLR